MISALDHVVIAVPDLDSAVEVVADGLGLPVEYGGAHRGRSTKNAVVPLGESYLELIAFEQAGARVDFDDRGEQLCRLIALGGGLLGYAVATTDLDSDLEAVEAAGLPVSAPAAGSRLLPDGRELYWRYAFVGGRGWETPFPFLIEWQRGPRPGSGSTRDDSAAALAGVTVAVDDVDVGVLHYGVGFGLTLVETSPNRACFRVGAAVVELLRRQDVCRENERRSRPGPVAVAVRVRDVEAKIAMIERAGIGAVQQCSDQHWRVQLRRDVFGDVELRFAEETAG